MDEVRLAQYTPLWKLAFLLERLRLQFALIGRIGEVQHIGSTAIPGMVAKPIIDILVAVPDFNHAFAHVAIIERLGYSYMGEREDLPEYWYTKGQPAGVHLYLTEKGSRAWIRRLSFRDQVIAQPELARQYALLKKKLARKFPHDLQAYQGGKRSFVDRVVGIAATGDRQAVDRVTVRERK